MSLVSFISETLARRRQTMCMNRYQQFATLGKGFDIEGTASIHNESGDPSRIEIGDYFRVCNGSITCKNGATVKIGSFGVLQDAALIRCADQITIGDFVGIAEKSVIVDNNTHKIGVEHWIKHRLTVAPGGPGYPGLGNGWELSDSAPVVIGDGVWIGSNCAILKGVTIGDGAVIARGSTVTRDVEPYTIVAGNPAKPVKQMDPPDRPIKEIAAELIDQLNMSI